MPDQLAQRVLFEHVVGVGKNHDLRGRAGHRAVEGGGFPAPRRFVQRLHALALETLHDLRRRVGRAVRDHQDMQPLLWVIRFQGVADLGLDHPFFIVGGDDQRYRWKQVAVRGVPFRRRFASAPPRQQDDDGGIYKVVVQQQRGGDEKNSLSHGVAEIICIKRSAGQDAFRCHPAR